MTPQDVRFLQSFEFVPVDHLVYYVPARTHKKKRINKKWEKRYGLKAVPDRARVIVVGRKIYAHPVVIKKFEEALKNYAD